MIISEPAISKLAVACRSYGSYQKHHKIFTPQRKNEISSKTNNGFENLEYDKENAEPVRKKLVAFVVISLISFISLLFLHVKNSYYIIINILKCRYAGNFFVEIIEDFYAKLGIEARLRFKTEYLSVVILHEMMTVFSFKETDGFRTFQLQKKVF